MARRKQKSCHQCRSRHLKCDDEQPCLHCRRASRECSKDSEHIFLNGTNVGIVRRKKKYDLLFDGDQTWMDLPSFVQFAEPAGSSSTSVTATECSRLSTPALVSSDSARDSHSPSIDSIQSRCVATSPEYAIDPLLLDDCYESLAPFESAFVLPGEIAKPVSVPIEPQWPFESHQEALLMQHYVKYLAVWFDFGGDHFRCTIPELAATSPVLLNAIFTISAKHLFLRGQLDESESLRYADKAYQALLPDLNLKALDADRLAAVLILRWVLQISDQTGGDIPIGFLGLEVFKAACHAHPTSSLHAQLFLTTLRLYLHEAWHLHQPIDLADEQVDLSSLAAFRDDPTRLYALKISIFATQVSNFAYGNKLKTWDRWLELKHVSEEIQQNTPTFFNPIFAQLPIEGDPFPRRMFANDLYAHTQQAFSVACIALINSTPDDPPSSEPSYRLPSSVDINPETLLLTRKVLGTAFSHFESMSCSVIALHAISYGGHLLLDPLEREHAWALLKRVKGHILGSNVFLNPAISQLRRIWRCEPEETPFANVL